MTALCQEWQTNNDISQIFFEGQFMRIKFFPEEQSASSCLLPTVKYNRSAGSDALQF